MQLKPKLVAVIGGAGFVGSALTARLSKSGYAVKVLTRHRERAKHLILLPNVMVVECNIMDGTDLSQQLRGVDIVVNLVGVLHQDSNNSFEKVHIYLPKRIAEICASLDICRLVHISALKADARAPSHYLRSKAAGEQALMDYSKRLDITILQPSVIFGRGDSFLNLFANLVKRFPVLPLICPTAKFQPIWVEDVAQAIVNVLENSVTYGHTYELAGPRIYSLRQLVQKIMLQLGKKSWIIGLNSTLSLMQASVMECLPGKLLTRDNVRSTMVDSVLSAPIAHELGITPTPLDAVIPEYIGGETPRAAYETFRSTAGRFTHEES
jgi:uncharacterized protein YbjT (DUF2867 family)